MKLGAVYQGLLGLIFVSIILCEDQGNQVEIGNKEFFKKAHHILQQGRIISQPKAVQSIPIDQVETSGLQQDDIDKHKSKFIAHGDILIPIEEIDLSDPKRIKRKVIAETNYFGGGNRWPRGVVPYQFASNLDYRVKQNVFNAIEHWHRRTCIRFEPYDPQLHWDIGTKITIEDTGSGCATYVGYRSSVTGQPTSYAVYLPIVCEFGSAIHELGHVIGFYHEMARTDRDKEINLYFNLMGTMEAVQYDIMPNPMPGYYGQPYDLSSIMQYYPTKVMSPRDNRRTFLMGQRNGLSFLDVKLANLAYHCSDTCSSKPVCENEGFVNQYCQCVCPDGFSGDRCQLLKGYSTTTRVLPTPSPPKPTETKETTSTTVKTTTATSNSIRWLEWSDWSDCSEACGTGVRVRTRLCSNTTMDSSSNPCSSLGGDSFEIESCQNIECKQNDIIMSCTFDLPNEICPIKTESKLHIQDAKHSNQIQPISDHTRGDGKYLFLTGNVSQLNTIQNIQLSPLISSSFSDKQNHCLQFWYSTYGQAIGKLQIVSNLTNKEMFIFNENDQNTNWKQFQQTISSNKTYELLFTYTSRTTEYNYMILDDISILNGVCPKKNMNRKRRQTTTGCSNIFDLTTTNNIVTITSPNYPNLYPSNIQCYYYIRAPISYRINLQFTDFNIPISYTNNCDDTLEIRYYHLGQVGPMYCGSGANSDNLQFQSHQNNLMIVFQSNQYYSGRGFRAQATLIQ